MRRLGRARTRPTRRDVAGDFDAENPQHQSGKGSGGHTRGLTSRGALQHVTSVGEVVLESAGEIRVSGTGRSDGLVLGEVAGLDGKFVFPVLPVAVDNSMAMGDPMVLP